MTDVLHVVSSTARRGAEIFGQQLHEGLMERGWRSDIVALAGAGEGGLDIECLGPTRRHPRTFAALRRRARPSAVVVAHGSTTLPLCAVALVGGGPPFVYRNIGDPDHWVRTFRQRAVGAALLRRTWRIAAISPTAAVRLERKYRLGADRVTVVPHGVPLERFPPATPARRRAGRDLLGVDPASPLVVYLGALGPEKLVGNAIAAVAGLPGVTLVVVGDGPVRGRLEQRAADGDGSIRVFGPTSDPALVLAAADVVVLPSATEGLPGVLIEAGLVGVPVVATDVGFVADIVTDETTGTLVAPDDVPALRHAIERRLAAGSSVPEGSRDRLRDRYGMEQVIGEWERLLEPCLTGRSPRLPATNVDP
jgi:glycosyltransferase involved in cell wall biosynthesis